MTELDNEFIPIALEVVEEFGKVFSYTVVEEPIYNPETQETTPNLTVMADIKMTPPEDVRDFSVVNGLAEIGDKQFYVPSAYFMQYGKEPSPEDIVNFDNENWTVKNVKEYFSGELIALYRIRVGK